MMLGPTMAGPAPGGSSGSASAMSAIRSPCTASDADPHDRVEKLRDALGELILVGQKGHQHAHRE